MSKKLTGNGLWESSRMMLPQHKEAAIARMKGSIASTEQPTREDLEMIRDYIFLPIMHTIVRKKSQDIAISAESLRLLYSQAAHVLAKNIQSDFMKVKKAMLERNIRVFEEEKGYDSMHYRYVCRGHEDLFAFSREIMLAEIGVRIGKYADNLVEFMKESIPKR
jgi:hypothetical protein